MRIVPALVILLATVAIAGCSKKVAPPCPPQTKLIDHARVTQFRDGPGRDITDIDYKAEMQNPVGECVFPDDENKVIISLQAVFDIERGPTANNPTENVPYYVALTTRDGEIIQKQTFTARLTYPERAASMRFIDGVVDIAVPLSDTLKANMLEIKTGFQLTEDQLRYNRAQIRR